MNTKNVFLKHNLSTTFAFNYGITLPGRNYHVHFDNPLEAVFGFSHVTLLHISPFEKAKKGF